MPVLNGTNSSDTISGSSGDDEIYGHGGFDVLRGLGGNDLIEGGDGTDIIYGGDGNDIIRGGSGNNTLYGDAGDDVIDGGSGNDHMTGGAGNDEIIGYGGTDYYFGGDGDDDLYGSTGADYFEGGLGGDYISTGDYRQGRYDRVIFNLGGAVSDSTYSNPDIVHLFTAGEDDIALQGADLPLFMFHLFDFAFAGPSAGGVQLPASLVGDGYADVVWHYDEANNRTDLWIDTDDNGIFSEADLFVHLNGRVNLGRADFYEALDAFHGSAGNDTINGLGTAAEIIFGGDGNDTIVGRGGDDTIDGGAGDDTLKPTDHYASTSGGFTTSYFETNIVRGGAGNDLIYNVASVVYIDAGSGDDWITLDSTRGSLDGGEGYDTMVLDFQWEKLLVHPQLTYAPDTFAEVDIFVDLSALWSGGVGTISTSEVSGISMTITGVERLGWATGVADVYMNNGNDIVIIGADYMFGVHIALLGGNDLVVGGSGNDTVWAGIGDDQLEGGAGNDLLDGESGNDTASYAGALAGVSVDLRITEAQDTLGAGEDRLVSIESLAGSSHADRLTGNDSQNRLSGGAGNDVLIAYAGNDILDGGAGADVMRGGIGDDIYHVDNAGDRIAESSGEGTDHVISSITLALSSNVENLTLTGTAVRAAGNNLANELVGNDSDNVINGGFGADIMRGGLGNDIYYMETAGDRTIEEAGAGRDRVYTLISLTLEANVEDVFMRGSAALNATGNALDNVLRGNSGNNVLTGAGGADDLRGAGGADTFVFRDGDFAGLSPSTSDRIIDFNRGEGDIIDLGGVDANTGLGGDQAFAFLGTGAFTGAAGQIRYDVINGNTYVTGDTNGDGVADFMIRLDGSHNLVGGDFIL